MWLRTWWYRCLSDIVLLFPLDVFPEVVLQTHMVVLLLIFWGTSVLFSIGAAPIYSHPNNAWRECYSVMSDSLWLRGLYSPWNSPGQKLEWVVVPFIRGSSQTMDGIPVSHIAGWFLCQLSHQESPQQCISILFSLQPCQRLLLLVLLIIAILTSVRKRLTVVLICIFLMISVKHLLTILIC